MSNTHEPGELPLHVTRRETLALLSALEISPFEDEVLIQKLLNLVYTTQPSTSHPSAYTRRARDFTHHRR